MCVCACVRVRAASLILRNESKLNVGGGGGGGGVTQSDKSSVLTHVAIYLIPLRVRTVQQLMIALSRRTRHLLQWALSAFVSFWMTLGQTGPTEPRVLRVRSDD